MPRKLQQEVVKEFPMVGRYRVRVLSANGGGGGLLDIREYVTSDDFNGFTRRGIRFATMKEVVELAEVLRQVRDDNLLNGQAETAASKK